MSSDNTPQRVLRKRDVVRRVGMSASTIYRLEQSGNFPRRFRVGDRAVAWLESDIEAWVRARAAS
jgi:prophage regulatory protein